MRGNMGKKGRRGSHIGNRIKVTRAAGRIALGFLALELVVAAVLMITVGITLMGERRLRGSADSERPSMEGEPIAADADTEGGAEAADSETVWQEGWVRHNGKIYEYNDDILTFLILGIDKMDKVAPNPDKVSGGQSDAIFLAVIDTGARKVSLVGVNRDTIVDIYMKEAGKNGEDMIAPAQLAVQHGFGDGMEESCELTEAAVSELFYDLPIHGYVSFNMGGIAALNDAMGGVDVTVLEDLTKKNKKWKEGTQVHLEGMDAFWYVKWRDTTIFESARKRLERQKQYLRAFADKAIAATKNDITLPVTLYKELKDYIVTDISIDEMAYLAKELIHYQFDIDTIYTMEGETIMGEEHEGFYPDKDALKDLMIQVFYREVESGS